MNRRDTGCPEQPRFIMLSMITKNRRVCGIPRPDTSHPAGLKQVASERRAGEQYFGNPAPMGMGRKQFIVEASNTS